MIQTPNEPAEPAITLRDYFDAKFGHLTDHVDEKFNALRDHVDTRIIAMQREAALAYPNREEYSKLELRVGKLERMDSEIHGKASQTQVAEMQMNMKGVMRVALAGLAFSALTILVTVVLFFARKG